MDSFHPKMTLVEVPGGGGLRHGKRGFSYLGNLPIVESGGKRAGGVSTKRVSCAKQGFFFRQNGGVFSAQKGGVSVQTGGGGG